MRAANLLVTGLRNARYYWRYSSAAALTVSVGCVALTLFKLYMTGVTTMMDSTWRNRFMYGDIIIDKERQSAYGPARLSSVDQAFVERFLSHSTVEVTARSRFLDGMGTIAQGKLSTVFIGRGYDAGEGAVIRGPQWAWDAVAGEPLQLATGQNDVVLGKRLAEVLGCRVGPTDDHLDAFGYPARQRPYSCPADAIDLRSMTVAGQINTMHVNPVGIVDGLFREVDSRLVQLPLEAMQRLMAVGDVSYYSVQLARPEQTAEFVAAFRADSAKTTLHLAVTPWREHPDADLYLRTLETLKIYETFLTVIMLTLAGLAVFASSLKLVEERTREIGTLRALGIGRPAILGVFAVESFVTATAGTLLGVASGLFITVFVNALRIPYQVGGMTQKVPFRIAIDPVVYGRVGVSLIGLCVLATVAALLRKMSASIASSLGDL